MKNSSFARRTIHLIALVLLIAAGCPDAHGTPEIRFQLVRNALIVVQVTADDEGPFYFLLDTGADTTIVDTALAKKLSLAALQSAQQTTITGSQTLNVSFMAKLMVGPAHREDLPVLVEDLSSLRRVDDRIAGIIGQDFLSHFNYLLDYRKQTLRFEEDAEMGNALDGDQVPMEAGGKRMIVTAEAKSGGRAKLRLLLDSGANALVLMGPASRALPYPIVQRGVETSSAGATVLPTARIDLLAVASREFHDVPATLVAEAPAEGIGDGLLPTALFEGIYINNHQGFVIFNPRAKKTSKLRPDQQ